MHSASEDADIVCLHNGQQTLCEDMLGGRRGGGWWSWTGGWFGGVDLAKNQVFSNSRTTYANAPYNFLSNKIHLLAFFGGFFVGGGSHAVTLAPNNDLLLPWFI